MRTAAYAGLTLAFSTVFLLSMNYVVTERGGVLFDVSTDQGLAKDVPPEAHRRFRADQRAYQEKVRQDQIAQAALHEEKKRFIAEWISANGTSTSQVQNTARRCKRPVRA